MLPVEGGALRTIDSLAPEAAADGDSNRDSDGEPDCQVSGGDSECGSHG
ncbi:MAG: hypothetical protein QOF56_1300, partial [Acidobacteriaceae bacterium]|nr:hypothetical protein [Acidobacteriaceae bacterium]